MPKQHVIFGRPVPRISSRRISLLLAAISIFAIFSLIISLPSAIPTGPSLSKFTDHKFSIPKLKGSSKWPKVFNPFKPPAHPPARQKNDTDGESSWYSNWRWLSIPFSSTITLDEGRSLLPDLQERPPIYCYYDTTVQKDAASKNAESALLLTWRRAWWYHGFRPVILSAAEAMNNPLYEELQRMEMESSLKTDLMTWLAWENMGGGLLSNYLVLPMSKYDDPLLTFLRRGEYPSLTRFRGLDNGLFVGPKNEIASAIKLAMQSHEIKAAGDIISVLPVEKEGDPFTIDNTPESLAFYNAKALERRFTKLGDLITKDRAAGLRSLNKLINAHLHTTWQNTFPDGIAVLKPVPKHTTKMIEPAWDLANRLAQCNDSPAPSTCPPNQERCVPCVSANVKLYTPAFYRNNTSIYTIGTVPHPYTFQTLAHMKESLDVPWVRRKSERDAWIIAVTRDILGDGMAGGPRLLKFKEAVAGPVTHTHSLWVEAERGIPEDIVDWHFGFAVPQLGEGLDSGKSETPVPGPERRPQPEHDKADGPIADPEELKREPALLEKARAMGRSKDKRDVAIRNAVEAWNLADTEAWRFARAFLARSQVERTKWEEEEAKYAEGVGSDKGHAKSKWGRWLDRGSK